MVILNTDISINRLYTIDSIKKIMNQVMEKYFEDEIISNKIEGKKMIFNNIIKDKMDYIKSNHFWYLISSDNNCKHVFKKGKKEGFMCQKKINTNLENNKKDYMCCKHSKLHIPKKRLNVKSNNKIYEVSKNSKNSENSEKIKNEKYIIKFNSKNKIKKKNKKLKPKRIILCNSGKIDFSKILKNIL